MADIITGLSNCRSAIDTALGFHYVAGHGGDGNIYCERFLMETSYRVNFWDNSTRKLVCAGTYCGITVSGSKVVVDVVGTGTYVSFDCGETWEAF